MEEFIKLIKDTDKPIILVDLSWVLYKSSFIFKEDTFMTSKGEPNGHLLGFTNLLKTCSRLGHLVFICEDGNCKFRKELNENYKANRQSKQFYLQLDTIEKLTYALPNVYCIKNESYEADDVLYSAAKVASQNNIKAYIHTADKDLFQAIDNNISIASKITLNGIELITQYSENYIKNFPVSPEKLPIYRAFKGDASDNLASVVPNIRKDLLLSLVNHIYTYGNIQNYKIEKKSHEKYIKVLIDNWNIFKTNYDIMKLKVIPFSIVKKGDSRETLIEAHQFELFGYESFVKNIKIYKGE